MNRKQAEIVLRLPRELEPLEGRVRDEVNKVVARGRVEVQVALEQPGVAKAAKINPALAASYAAELRGLADRLGLVGGVTLEVLVRCPGVIEVSEPAQPEAGSLWPAEMRWYISRTLRLKLPIAIRLKTYRTMAK